MNNTPALSLSTSERQTLRYIAEGQVDPRELDWLALQRLKRAGLMRSEGPGRLSRPRAGAPCSGSWLRPDHKHHPAYVDTYRSRSRAVLILHEPLPVRAHRQL